MIRDGLVDEVSSLVKKDGRTPAAFDAIGYREIIGYMNGECSLDKAVAIMKINTWRYAKRQITWLKNMDPRGG